MRAMRSGSTTRGSVWSLPPNLEDRAEHRMLRERFRSDWR
jgi:hypothetical protein